MADERPQLRFVPFDNITKLAAHLGIVPPPFRELEKAFLQLENVGAHAASLGCRALAIESMYIDRDYMEDHSAFYAKSLHSYENWCTRVHFFSVPVKDVEERLRRLTTDYTSSGFDAFAAACDQFSDETYLGFSVIKPLRGSPVGRTILRPQLGSVGRFSDRMFSVHLAGVELSIRGVPFQQQDVGVSACATTALWSSLSALGAIESLTPATPAQITALASKYTCHSVGRCRSQKG